MSVPVVATLPRYVGAIAELPSSLHAAATPDGAIAVVSGAGRWTDTARVAVAAGAVGVVVSRPGSASADGLDALAAEGVPVVLERRLVRPDAASDVREALDAAEAPAALVVESHSPPASAGSALLDALGWIRTILGHTPELAESSFARGRGLALLTSRGGAGVSLVAAASGGVPLGGRVRVTGLGTTLLEVEAERDDVSISLTGPGGRRDLPRRFETAERLALRRAMDAVATGRIPEDLADLAADAALAGAIERHRTAARSAASHS
jgi:hypothetical protein